MAKVTRCKIKACKPLDANRLYPKELVARIKHRYLTHKVLGYHPRGYIMELLAREFNIDRGKLDSLLHYEGMFRR